MREGLARSAVLLLLLAGGCLGASEPPPPDRFYRVVPAEEARAAAPAPRFEGTLEVERFTGEGLVGQRAILFRARDAEREVRQHHYDHWVEAPTRMLQEELATYLRRREVAPAVVTPEMRVRPDFVVTGHIRRFERLLGSRPRVLVELRLAVREEASGRLLWSETYRSERAAEGESVRDSVAAFDASLGELFARFVEDLGGR